MKISTGKMFKIILNYICFHVVFFNETEETVSYSSQLDYTEISSSDNNHG